MSAKKFRAKCNELGLVIYDESTSFMAAYVPDGSERNTTRVPPITFTRDNSTRKIYVQVRIASLDRSVHVHIKEAVFQTYTLGQLSTITEELTAVKARVTDLYKQIYSACEELEETIHAVLKPK